MLPCLGNADSKIGVQSRRGNYVNYVYIRIVGDSFQIVVAVDIFPVEIVVRSSLLAFFRMASYNAGKITILGLAQRWSQFTHRVSAESQQRDTKLPLSLLLCLALGTKLLRSERGGCERQPA